MPFHQAAILRKPPYFAGSLANDDADKAHLTIGGPINRGKRDPVRRGLIEECYAPRNAPDVYRQAD